MRGFKLVSAAVVSGSVMMLAILPVAGASAKKVLEIVNSGNPVATGSAANTAFFLGGCFVHEEGTVTVNGGSKDVMKDTGLEQFECEGGGSVSGLITETQLTTSGKTKTAGTITITKEPGPCVYEFKTFKGSIGVPGEIYWEGTTKGKLNKTASDKTKGACATKVEEPYIMTDEEGEGAPLHDEL